MAPNVGDDIVTDLAILVNRGLELGYSSLIVLPTLAATAARCRSDTASGSRAAIRSVVEDALGDLNGHLPEYAAAARALLLLGAKTSSASQRRKAAGEVLGKGGENFRRHYEAKLLEAVADAIRDLDASTERPRPTNLVDVQWETIGTTLRMMHRDIERDFGPDVVLTMSGPGSFAAFWCLSMDPRDVPVVACTTFPSRQRPSPSQQLFAAAAHSSTWRVVETSKWVVYLPTAIGAFPSRSRVLIFDDRVLSGDTQQAVRALLEEAGYEVRTAAMIVGSDSRSLVNFSGMSIDDDYVLPWGTKRGRK